MDDERSPRIIVTDTGPLITLAAGDALDYLLIPGIPIIIPDAVYFEATRYVDRLGAQSIIDWSNAHVHDVQIVPTQAFASYLSLLVSGNPVPRDTGERAAIEVGRYTSLVTEGECCLLISEDFTVLNGKFTSDDDDERIALVSTYQFLRTLEDNQRINSVDAVYKRAEDAGRYLEIRQDREQQHDRAMAALEAVLKTNGPKS